MKYLFFLSLLLCCVESATAQADATFYLNEAFKPASKGEHAYYQVIKDSKTKGVPHQQTTFYLSGTTYSKGMFSVEDMPMGVWEFYYPNGNIREKIFYERVPAGYYALYYDDGQMQLEGTVLKQSKSLFPENVRISNYWNPDRTQLVREGQGRLLITTNEVEMEGKIKNGLKDSIWYGRSLKHQIDFAEVYKEGAFVSGVSIDSTDATHRYDKIDVQATPQGGFSELFKYIVKNYTPAQRTPGAAETYVSFVVGTDGKLADFKIHGKDKRNSADEFIAVLKAYPDWTPKSFRGVKFTATYKLPLLLGAGYDSFYHKNRELINPSRQGQVFPSPPLSDNRPDFR